MKEYSISYNKEDKSWKILDLTHPKVKELAEDSDIPDDLEAITTLDEQAFQSLLDVAKQIFPEKFSITKISKNADKDKMIKNTIIDLIKNQKNSKELLIRALVLQVFMEKLK